jgi:hypothetical protein
LLCCDPNQNVERVERVFLEADGVSLTKRTEQVRVKSGEKVETVEVVVLECTFKGKDGKRFLCER